MKKYLIYYKYGKGGEVFFVQLLGGESVEKVKEDFLFLNPEVEIEDIKILD